MNKPLLVTQKNEETCPQCQGKLVIRQGAYGPFQRCENYPKCHYLKPLTSNSESHIIKTLDEQYCPICQAVLVLRQGRYGLFIGCSNYPTCHYIVSTQTNNETTIDCPKCGQGQLIQRNSRFGKQFYGCSNYPTCQFTLAHKPINKTCLVCHYPLLLEKNVASGKKYYCANKVCGAENNP